MNEVDTQSKTAAIKTLAIIGFIATLVLVVWVAVQVIRVLPGAFTSLASIAESISGYRPAKELTVSTAKSVVNAGESFSISWTNMKRDGMYTFMYECTDGVSLDMRVQDAGGSDIFMVPCDTAYRLPQDVYAMDILVSSEKRRFIDVPFSLTLVGEDDEVLFAKSDRITVVNATIPQSSDIARARGEETNTTTSTGGTDTTHESTTTTKPTGSVLGETTTTGSGTGATTPKPVTKTPGTPVVTTSTYTYMPQSDPKGYTDLKLSYLGVGSYTNEKFVPEAVLDNDIQSAVKFEVKNTGTKTSEKWSFTATLPSGYVYKSKVQDPLKPNERAEFTLGFSLGNETLGDEFGVEKIKVVLDVDGDKDTTNNSFNWAVTVAE